MALRVHQNENDDSETKMMTVKTARKIYTTLHARYLKGTPKRKSWRCSWTHLISVYFEVEVNLVDAESWRRRVNVVENSAFARRVVGGRILIAENTAQQIINSIEHEQCAW